LRTFQSLLNLLNKNQEILSINSFFFSFKIQGYEKGVNDMPLLEISIIPVGTDSTSFSSEVINAVRKLKEKELHYDVTPTSTIIEGELEQLWQVAKEIHQEAISSGPNRVITNISIDHRKDKKTDMNHQIDTVENAID
jgi:uncharacterized protein (TIGR00106 family)